MYIPRKMWSEENTENMIQFDPEHSSSRFCYGGTYYHPNMILISFYNNQPFKIKKEDDFAVFYKLFAEEVRNHK